MKRQLRTKRSLNEGWDRMTRRSLSDPESPVEMVSGGESTLDMNPCVDTGQHRGQQLTCPSPPEHGTSCMASMKRSPSPPEDSGPEWLVRKKRRQSECPADDDADSAEGSNSTDNTLTTTDHPAEVDFSHTTTDHPADVDTSQTTTDHPADVDNRKIVPAGIPNTVKLSCKGWNRLPLIYYSSIRNCFIYPDLSNRFQSIPLILKLFYITRHTPEYDSDSTIKNVVSIQHKKMLQSLETEKKQKVNNKNQYAFIFFGRKDGSYTDPSQPYFPKDKGHVHSEDFIVNAIRDYINNGSIHEYRELWIFTLNSPCLGRKGTDPCMIKLTRLSDELDRHYKIKTFITFSQPYGPTGSVVKVLPDHIYRTCSYRAIRNSAHHQDPPPTIPETEQFTKSSKFRRKRCDSLPADIYIYNKPLTSLIVNQNNYHSKPPFKRSSSDRSSKNNDFNKLLESARDTLLTTADRESKFLIKPSPGFTFKNVMNSVKENIPKDKWKILFNGLNECRPECPKTPHSFKEYESMGLNRSEECEKSLRALFSEEFNQSVCNSICEMFILTFLSWWASNLEHSYGTFLNMRFSEAYNRKAVEMFIHDIQDLPYKPTIVCVGDITDSQSIG